MHKIFFAIVLLILLCGFASCGNGEMAPSHEGTSMGPDHVGTPTDTAQTAPLPAANPVGAVAPTIQNQNIPTQVPAPQQNAAPQANGSMVFVEGGSFQMGSNGGDANEKPVHAVTLAGYYIGETEVTQAQWQTVMGNNPSGFSGCSDCPVENVSWNDVQAFIQKLSAQTGKEFRLPTEAEWEFAARGGNLSKKYNYVGGNELNAVGWFKDNSSNMTHPVKGKKPNELGLYDMSGNVWEWCDDSFGNYPSESQHNPNVRGKDDSHVIRGGGWAYKPSQCRPTARAFNAAGGKGYGVGFRLACTK